MLGGELTVTSGVVGGEITAPVTPPVGIPTGPPPFSPAQTGRWHAGPDLGMIADSKTTAAMDANKAGFDSLYADRSNKARRGGLYLGAGSYYIRNPLAVDRMCGVRIEGCAGVESYASENHYGNNAFGGPGSQLVAGASGLPYLLSLNTYGGRVANVTLRGDWRQGPDDPWQIASRPETLIYVPPNSGDLPTGKCVFDNLALEQGRYGITFGEDDEDNADNCEWNGLRVQDLEEYAIRIRGRQAVVFQGRQLKVFRSKGAILVERGGLADFGQVEVVDARFGVGAKVLHLVDPRENEADFAINTRFDPTAKAAGLKAILMDQPGWGTVIRAHHRFGENFTFDNASVADVIDLYGGCQVTLTGGPYYANCLRLRSFSGRQPNVFFSGATFGPGVHPSQCVNVATSAGNWSTSWAGCSQHVTCVPIAPGEWNN